MKNKLWAAAPLRDGTWCVVLLGPRNTVEFVIRMTDKRCNQKCAEDVAASLNRIYFNQRRSMGQKIPLADELDSEHLIDLGQKLESIMQETESLQLTKTGKPVWEVRLELDYIRLSVLEAMAILDGNPR